MAACHPSLGGVEGHLHPPGQEVVRLVVLEAGYGAAGLTLGAVRGLPSSPEKFGLRW